MALDKNKIIAEATKLVQRGSYDKAITTYQRILSEDPKDVRVLLKVGELYQKMGRLKLAAAHWQRALEEWSKTVPGDVDQEEVAKAQKKLEAARVKLAQQGR